MVYRRVGAKPFKAALYPDSGSTTQNPPVSSGGGQDVVPTAALAMPASNEPMMLTSPLPAATYVAVTSAFAAGMVRVVFADIPEYRRGVAETYNDLGFNLPKDRR